MEPNPKSSITRIEFKKYTFKSGLNWTVRRGKSAYDALKPLDSVHLVEVNNPLNYSDAVIHMVIKCRLADLPGFVLKAEHDPYCQNLAGLLETLQDVYGDFNALDPVTAIGFVPVEAEHKV